MRDWTYGDIDALVFMAGSGLSLLDMARALDRLSCEVLAELDRIGLKAGPDARTKRLGHIERMMAA